MLGNTLGKHLHSAQPVFQQFRTYGQKCGFFKKEVNFLGQKISPEGVVITDSNLGRTWVSPTSKTKTGISMDEEETLRSTC